MTDASDRARCLRSRVRACCAHVANDAWTRYAPTHDASRTGACTVRNPVYVAAFRPDAGNVNGVGGFDWFTEPEWAIEAHRSGVGVGHEGYEHALFTYVPSKHASHMQVTNEIDAVYDTIMGALAPHEENLR